MSSADKSKISPFMQFFWEQQQHYIKSSFENVQSIASHVLVLMVHSIVNPFKFSLATFATTGANSTQLFTIFWKAVGILKISCKLKLLAVTCNGASPNRKFFKMHSRMEDKDHKLDDDVNVTYCNQIYTVLMTD